MGEPAPIAQSRWRVLPVGLGPALQRQALRASVHVMVGLGVLFGTVVVAGIVSEELLSDSEAGSTIDLAGRASLAGMLILLVLAFLALGVLGASAAVGLLALQLMFALAYPDRERWSGGRAGERAELDPRGEQLVDLVVAGVGVCGALVLLCLLLALACEVLARRAEMRAVRTALAAPAAPPPAMALLRGRFAAGAPRLLLAVHSLAGAVAAIGLGLWVVPIGEDGPSWEIFSSAGPTLRSLDAQAPLVLVGALMVLAAGILLAAVLDVREQRLRDELVRRWPMRADPSPAAEA